MQVEAGDAQISPELMQDLLAASEDEMHAYLAGASRDGTISRRHGTLRFAQADQRWLTVLHVLLARLGYKSWSYREGQRNVWVLETSYRLREQTQLRSSRKRAAFVRGYFDAEGGVPRDAGARFYIQMVQKNRPDLQFVADILETLGIKSGRLHNPSQRVDPDYWRFFVRCSSHDDFVAIVGSWHPRKRLLLASRWPKDCFATSTQHVQL